MKKIIAITLICMILCSFFTGCNASQNKYENSITETSSNSDNSNSTLSTEDSQTETNSKAPTICPKCNTREVEAGYSYCSSCKCWETDCDTAYSFGSPYCEAHKCLYCNKARYLNSSFCYSHKCKRGRCGQPAVYDGYCNEHLK